MLTVKHTAPDWCEALYSAREVRYQPERANGGQPPQPESVFLYGGDVGMESITRGMVYVMNDAGSTVAKYDLELKNQPPEILKAA